jgi:hypothetical protein
LALQKVQVAPLVVSKRLIHAAHSAGGSVADFPVQLSANCRRVDNWIDSGSDGANRAATPAASVKKLAK